MLTNDFLFIALFFVVFVVHGVKRRFMVAPAGQSPLFGCRAYLILKIAVRLCKGLTSQRVQFFDAGQLALPFNRGLDGFLRCGEKPDRRAFLQPAGRFALSTFRRDLFYVYGT